MTYWLTWTAPSNYSSMRAHPSAIGVKWNQSIRSPGIFRGAELFLRRQSARGFHLQISERTAHAMAGIVGRSDRQSYRPRCPLLWFPASPPATTCCPCTSRAGRIGQRRGACTPVRGRNGWPTRNAHAIRVDFEHHRGANYLFNLNTIENDSGRQSLVRRVSPV